MDAVALPAGLRRLRGRITDVDTHEMIPAQEWVNVFGPEILPLARSWMDRRDSEQDDKNHPNVPDYAGDVLPIGADIGDIKGPRAPGAMDCARRLDVMDAMGVARQLMFPTNVGMDAFRMLTLPPDDPFHAAIGGDRHMQARRWLRLYNDWGIRAARISDRIRPVLPVAGDTPAELIANARALIDGGIRALWFAAGHPPGGVSPAHPDLDPLWRLLADTGTVATLHIATEAGFLSSTVWKEAPAFNGYRALGEFDADPWSLSVVHLPCQNFVATMVLGGVFERHPALRFGVIEVGSSWVGPMMENLDTWHANFKAFATGHAAKLPLAPSDYVRRNVRVAIFPFEKVDVSIERYGLEDVLCFCTDYPHVEGGRSALHSLYAKIARLGDEVVEKFFVTNGEWLLPD